MAKRREYIPINPGKYNGRTPIILKSSWEEHFAQVYCDLNEACVEWAYEPVRIPYRDPVTGKQTIYIPDFLMAVRTNTGRIITSLCEIKPLHEALQEHARNRKDAMVVARNIAKWEVARAWCRRRSNVQFLVLTEAHLFPGGEHIKPRKRPIRPYVTRRVKKK